MKTYYIKKLNRGLPKLINHISFDVETDTYHLKFKLAVVSHRDKYYTSFNKLDMTNDILKSIRERHLNLVWSHQSEFDFSYLDFNRLMSRFELKAFNTSPFFAIFYSPRNKTRLIFIDSLNFIKDSLANIGDLFSLPKLKIDFKTCSMRELEVYCNRDVEILNKIIDWIMNIQKTFDVPFSITLPALSFNIFRKHFLKTEIKVPMDRRILQLERDSYFGGRVEIFDMSVQPFVNVYDFNSLYPSQFYKKVPVECIQYFSVERCLQSKFKLMLKRVDTEIKSGNLVICRVRLKIPYMKYPPIPYRDIESKKLLFPVGSFNTVLTTEEIIEVFPYITDIKEFAIYKGEPILKEFGEHFYNLRVTETDKTMKLVYKLLLNSLYGKFAQRKFKDTRVEKLDNIEYFKTTDIIDDETGTKMTVKWVAGVAFIKEIEEINPKSMVSISSHITAYARIKLLNALRESDSVYCDTDSIFTTKVFYDSKELGELKHEKTLHNFRALGNKFYTADELMKCKGVPKDADIIEVYEKSILFGYNRIAKIQENIRRFKEIEPKIIPVIKEISLSYDKRIILNNGETKSITLDE